MRKITLIIAVIMITMTANAQRSLSEMQRIAAQCLTSGSGTNAAKGSLPVTGVKLKAMSSELSKLATTDNEAFAVFTPETGKGFVIVSTNEKMPAILASGNEGYFETEKEMIPSLRYILDSYVAASEAIAQGKATAEQIFGNTSNILTAATGGDTQGPLLGNINYDQDAPYNLLCPKLNGEYTATGCGPTSMAMVMKYYGYPEKGTGNISYTTETNKLSVKWDLDNTPFDWSNMLDTYTGYYEPTNVSLVNDPYIFVFNANSTPCGITLSSYEDGYLQLNQFYNISENTVSGVFQLLIYDSSSQTYHPASAAVTASDVPPRNGYKLYPYIKPNFPSTLADGTYKVYAGFSTDGKTYNKLLKYDAFYSMKDYYITVTKKGNVYTCLDKEFQAASTYDEAKPVATLMAACGAAAEADYGEETSVTDVPLWMAANTHFGYDKDMYVASNNIASTDTLCILAKAMLDARHIIPISGVTDSIQGSDGKNHVYGHSFLIDGYDMTGANPMFHINWGWNGRSNNYFLLTQMTPYSSGTGGSTVNYSYNFKMFMNVMPENSTLDGYAIGCDSVSIGKTTLKQGETTPLALEIYNYGISNSITQSLNVYLVDNNGKAYKTAYALECSSSDPINPFHGGTIEWKDFTVPATIPDGIYHIDLLVDPAKDHFLCKCCPKITIGNPTGISSVQNDDVIDTSADRYDLSGRKANGNQNGIFIMGGKKVVFTR